MPTVDCLILRQGRLLMIRRAAEKTQAGALLPIGGKVERGESPLEACAREVREETGYHVTPSCVALIVNETQAGPLDYRLSFIAEAPAGEPTASSTEGSLEWVALADLAGRADVPAHDRELIPHLIAAGAPLMVVLEVNTSTEPWQRTIKEIALMDLARLSPLVFSIAT